MQRKEAVIEKKNKDYFKVDGLTIEFLFLSFINILNSIGLGLTILFMTMISSGTSQK